jgi:hypothetical protein
MQTISFVINEMTRQSECGRQVMEVHVVYCVRVLFMNPIVLFMLAQMSRLCSHNVFGCNLVVLTALLLIVSMIIMLKINGNSL